MKSNLSVALVDEHLAEVEIVSKMPDHHGRSARLEKMRVDLVNQSQRCLDRWKLLRYVIEEKWPREELGLTLKDIGMPHYNDSANQRWEACATLFSSAETFIAANLERLSQPQVMGPQFSESFSAEVKLFKTLYAGYLDAQNSAHLETEAKMIANNKLYDDLRSMFKIARLVFRGDDAMLKLFYFDGLVDRISGVGSSGIKGVVSNGKVPAAEIEGLKLVLAETGEEANVDEDGAYRFSRIPVGSYTLRISAPGYVAQEIASVNVKPGTYSTLNVVLVPETPPDEKVN